MSAEKQWYIDYFNHMQKEEQKRLLGGMAWDDLAYHADRAIGKGLFTIKDLKEQWPSLWGWLKEE